MEPELILYSRLKVKAVVLFLAVTKKLNSTRHKYATHYAVLVFSFSVIFLSSVNGIYIILFIFKKHYSKNGISILQKQWKHFCCAILAPLSAGFVLSSKPANGKYQHKVSRHYSLHFGY